MNPALQYLLTVICDTYLGRSWKASQILLPPLCTSVSGKFHPIYMFICLLVEGQGSWHAEHVKGFLQVYIRYSFYLLCELFFIWRHSDPCNISTPSCENTRNTVFDMFKGVETITINHSKVWKWLTQVKDKVLDFPFSYTGENWELLVSICFVWLNGDNNQVPWLLIKFDITLVSCSNPLNGTMW